MGNGVHDDDGVVEDRGIQLRELSSSHLHIDNQ